MGDDLLMYDGWVRLDDPLKSFPPTAQRLLAAAQRLLDRDGFGGLSLQRIADEAGEHKSLIAYHFGGKDGLVEVLADAAWHDDNVELLRHMRKHPPGPEPMAGALIDVHRRLALDHVSYRRFVELFPHVVRGRELRQRLSRLYHWYRNIDALYLGGGEAAERQSARWAVLSLAVLDGMAVLHLTDPERMDGDAVFGLWKQLLEGHFAGTLEPLAWQEAHDAGAVADAASELSALAPSSDPAAALTPVGRRLLAAAQKVLRRKGLSGVTLDAVAAAAGEPRSAVWYYFGDKRTLLHAIVDARTHRLQTAYLRRAKRLPPGSARVAATLDIERALLRGLTDFAVYYELLPAILRDAELQATEARFQEWLRTCMLFGLFGVARPQDPTHVVLASLNVAVPYGLGMQMLLDPKSQVTWEAFDLWRDLQMSYLVAPSGASDTVH